MVAVDAMRIVRGLAGSKGRWRGHVDTFQDSTIIGWAYDTSSPNRSIEVQIVSTSGKKMTALADIYRKDLQDAGYGDGHHGFSIDVSSWSEGDGSIELRAAESGRRLTTSPMTPAGFVERKGMLNRRDPSTRWRGHIDMFDRNVVTGWAVDLDNLHRRLEVEAVSKTGKRLPGVAGDFRVDLREHGFGDGHHVFKIDLRTLAKTDGPIDLVIVESGFKINAKPLEFDLFKMLRDCEVPLSVRHLIQAAAQTLENLYGDDAVSTAARDKTPAPAPAPPITTLFETAQPTFDPDGLITKFLQYESFRIDREKYEFAMAGTVQDRLLVVMWYLVKYLRDRNYAYRVPLSKAQVDFLNRPIPLAGYPAAVSVAFLNFMQKERPEFANVLDPAVLRKAMFWWCCERTPRDRLDTTLVTKEQVAVLAIEEQFGGELFPFNGFMAEYFNCHTELHALSMVKPLDRAIFVHYLVLKSFAEPYITRFLPRDSVRMLLQANADGLVNFDGAIAHLAAPAGAGPIDGAELRRKGEALLARFGYGLRRNPAIEAHDSAECLLPKRDLSASPETGVALIGPIQKASGLGQATRLSYDVLKRAEPVAPTTLTFDLDNPAPVGFGASLDLKPYQNRREINIIHLNAESIPLAYAFEQQEIFAASYNVGYFFWELNKIPKCHHLALELLDEIWVSSEYNREIYEAYTKKPVINVGMAVEPLPKVAPMERSVLGLEPDATVFLTTFDSFSFIERKNPYGVIETFQAAFPRGDESAQLVLKTQNRGRVFDEYQMELWKRIDRVVDEDPRIIVINETYQYRDLLALKLACDCYVSLHRAEGWGFGMLEAMQLGRPVIATSYSGNMDFCTDETTYLVDYDLVGVREAEYIFVERGSLWAEPRRAHGAARMREIARDPVAARAKGEIAARHIKANFSIEAIAKRYGARLAEIRAGRSAA